MPSIRLRYNNVCNSDQIQSPITGKCVKKDRKTRVNKIYQGPCNANQIHSPKTGKCIRNPRHCKNEGYERLEGWPRCKKICVFGRQSSGKCRKKTLIPTFMNGSDAVDMKEELLKLNYPWRKGSKQTLKTDLNRARINKIKHDLIQWNVNIPKNITRAQLSLRHERAKEDSGH